MRFHLLAPPNVQTTAAYSLDGFAMATIRMARLLKSLDHHVTLYASEENEAPCDELVTVVTRAEQAAMFDGIENYQYAASHANGLKLWTLVNERMATAIGDRKQPRDFLLTIGGTAQESVAQAHPDLMCVEYSIGYVGSFAKYRVYQSHNWRALTTGAQRETDGRFFDAVIPMCFDPAEHPFRAVKEPFALYVGRLTFKKGIGIACEAAAQAGVPLKVIGHGDPALVTHGAEYLGTLSSAERNEWMARAQCVLTPTIYVEPFGAVAVEAQMSGTPVISTDFGAFVETVEQGRTGYRCAYLGEFVQAIRDAPKLDPHYIRQRAVEQYAIAACAPLYQNYFNRLNLLWNGGWSTKAPA